MADPCITQDGQILWLQLPKEGTPPAWAPETVYQLGDTVVPISPTTEQENIMFMCVGFARESQSSEPAFPAIEGQTVIDGDIQWIARDPNQNPGNLDFNEYYEITENITVS